MSRRNKNIVFNTWFNDFFIAIPDIGDVLPLRTDKVYKKVPFDIFRGILSDYIFKEFDNSKDIVDIVNMITYPKNKFEINENPKEMTEEELKSEMNRNIQDQCVNIYVIREQKLDDNIGNIFLYIWGQCTCSLL